MTELSQVSCIGEPQPRSWDDFERGCMGTYRGGHHEPETAEAFCHGMATVFNLLRAEFPPAELCKASPDLLVSLQEAEAFIGIMFGRGEDAAVPETVTLPLGVPCKLGEI